MSTGPIAITTLQNVSPAPSQAPTVQTSDEAGHFAPMYQQLTSAASSSDAQQEAPKTATGDPAQKQEEASSTSLTHPRSRQGHVAKATEHDGHQDNTAKTDDTSSAANMVAGLIIASPLRPTGNANDQGTNATSPAGWQRVDPQKAMDTAQRLENQPPALPLNSSVPTRQEAMQQALAMQQLIEQQHHATATDGAQEIIGELKKIRLNENRADASASLATSDPSATEHRLNRPSQVTATSSNAVRQVTDAASSGLHSRQGGQETEPVFARSQTDFGLQQALSNVSPGHETTAASQTGDSLPPIDSSNWHQALASHISSMSRLDQGQTTLTLAPASLGALQVSLQMDRGQAEVQFMTHNRQAHEALSSSLDALHHALADQGIQLHSVSVVEHHADAGQQTSQQQHAFSGMASDQQASQQQSQQQRSRADQGLATTATDTDEPSVEQSEPSSSAIAGWRATA